jgi:hypothetical protein
MMKIDQVDLAFLHLGLSNNGKFDELDLAKSELSYLGVGRTLDRLATLKEKNMIELDGASFRITDSAMELLWNKTESLQNRILRLLQIKSFGETDIVKYLLEPAESIHEKIEMSRKEGFLIFTTIKKDDKVTMVCEITAEGNEFVQLQSLDTKTQLQRTLESISKKVQDTKVDDEKIKLILQKIRDLATELD